MVTVQMSYENLGNFPRFEITLLQLNLTAFPTIKKPNLQEFDKFLIWNAKMKWAETEIMSTTNLPIGQLKSSTRYSSCRCRKTACSSQKCKLHSIPVKQNKKGQVINTFTYLFTWFFCSIYRVSVVNYGPVFDGIVFLYMLYLPLDTLYKEVHIGIYFLFYQISEQFDFLNNVLTRNSWFLKVSFFLKSC